MLRLLGAVELEIKLEAAATVHLVQFSCEVGIIGKAHAIGVQENIVDARVRLRPGEEPEKLGMERGLAPGELEDLNLAFPRDDTVNALLEVLEGDGVDFFGLRRVRVARRAGQVAAIDDFDQRQAGGKRLKGILSTATRAAAATGRRAAGNVVKAFIAADTNRVLTVGRAGALEVDLAFRR